MIFEENGYFDSDWSWPVLFVVEQIPQQDHDQMLRVLNETDPEAVDFLLRRKAAHIMR